MMGDEDTLQMNNYSKSVRCKSGTAELLVIDSLEFFKAIKQNEKTQDFIQNLMHQRQAQEIETNTVNNYMLNLKPPAEVSVTETIPKEKKIHAQDFFQFMFCGDLFPERKVNWIANHKTELRTNKPAQRPMIEIDGIKTVPNQHALKKIPTKTVNFSTKSLLTMKNLKV